MQVADLTEASTEFEEELAGLQAELTSVTVAKLVLETDKAGYTHNLIEARQAAEELREQLGTNDGGTRLSELDGIEETLVELSYEGETPAYEPIDNSKGSQLIRNVWE